MSERINIKLELLSSRRNKIILKIFGITKTLLQTNTDPL